MKEGKRYKIVWASRFYYTWAKCYAQAYIAVKYRVGKGDKGISYSNTVSST